MRKQIIISSRENTFFNASPLFPLYTRRAFSPCFTSLASRGKWGAKSVGSPTVSKMRKSQDLGDIIAPLCWTPRGSNRAILPTEVAARQLHAVVALLVARGLHPIILGDRRSRLRAVSGTGSRFVGVQSVARQKQSRLLSSGSRACSWSDRGQSQGWGLFSMQG